MNQYHKLYTPEDSAVVFIDHQPQMLFGVASMDRASLINNVTLLAKCAKEFNVPAVLTAVETEGFSGYVWPMLLDVFPGQPIVERSSMNSWDDAGFRKAIEATGKKNIIMTGLWTEVCVTWPTIEMLGAGYNVYVVEDYCGFARMATRLGEKGTLRRPHEVASSTGRGLRSRGGICLHDGSPRAANRAEAASCAEEGGPLSRRISASCVIT